MREGLDDLVEAGASGNRCDRLYDPRPSYVGPGKVDLIKAAFLYLRQETNRKLKQYPLNVLFRNTPTKEPHKVIEPSSLLSAMWYQFFLAGGAHVAPAQVGGAQEPVPADQAEIIIIDLTYINFEATVITMGYLA